MLIWALQQNNIPISYSIGTTISYGASGQYTPDSEYFIYECDEFDRNFLHFSPYLSIITSIDYDHPDTYPTEDEYKAAFRQFITQSKDTILWQQDYAYIEGRAFPNTEILNETNTLPLKLPGAHYRRNATLVVKALESLSIGDASSNQLILESFPGTDRRFERLAHNLYSDYGHHPVKIAATLRMAKECSDSVVLVYQPHQNIRQHEVIEQYTNDIFHDAKLP
jgi:UDP-N-acetylmuramate--alanine ligase